MKRAIVLQRDEEAATFKPLKPKELLLRGFPKDLSALKAVINKELLKLENQSLESELTGEVRRELVQRVELEFDVKVELNGGQAKVTGLRRN